MKTPILEVKSLHKSYKDVNAVNGLSFSITEGTCFGLLGPNGAGKTTTIEMIEGITAADSGEILFRGHRASREFRERSGIQFQSTSLQDYLTVREVLGLFSSFYRRHRSIDELVRLCSLAEFLDRDTHKLSGGQRQRVLLAVALVNDPEIIFLDEPTTGLDPQARRNFWDLIRMIRKEGKTIVLTTHYMEEAYTLCDEIAIMDKGRVIAFGEPDHLLKEHFDGVSIEIPLEDLGSARLDIPGSRTDRDGRAEIRTDKVNEAMTALLAAKIPLGRMKVRSQTLEDLFLELTGRDLRT